MAEPAPRSRVRDALRVIGHARRTIAMVAAVDRRLLLTLVLTQLLDALSLVGAAWVGKRIVDAIAHQRSVRAALTWVGVELGIMVARALVTQAQSYAGLVLRAKLGLHVNLLILDKAAKVAYARFEDPAFVNAMSQARREASSRPLDLVNQVLGLARQIVTLVGFAALLFSLGPWAVLILVATAVPPFWAEARYAREQFEMQRARTLRNRRSFYLEAVLTTEQTVKEVKLFQLARWLRDKFRDILASFAAEESALARRRIASTFLLGLLATLALYGTYAWIVVRTIEGAITLGAMTLYLVVFRQGQETLRGALSSVARAYEADLYLTNLEEFLASPEEEPDADDDFTEVPGEEDHAPSIELEDVTFRYQGATRDALTHVSLRIPAGQTVALVGKNGAGKTTLIKLLVGLHRPTEGRILVDGADVATLSMSALRRRVGVIFQDFAKLQLSARENVGVGWLPSKDDDAAIGTAIEDAGAKEIMARLPGGLDTPLGRAFGGDDLSGGQWQRVALARAFMRKSRILVLDEPTAAMDAEAEHEIFQRFRDLKRDRTAILITHRFSTVRMADRVVVVDDGRIVEDGTHEALLAQDGLYARMFKLQAEGYLGA
ncbi:MAG: ABC transporter ATP-binding protein [Myxococcales bacterium]|nr:ABC transporter ATP-binding protein [Myxococcales bacterium]